MKAVSDALQPPNKKPEGKMRKLEKDKTETKTVGSAQSTSFVIKHGETSVTFNFNEKSYEYLLIIPLSLSKD